MATVTVLLGVLLVVVLVVCGFGMLLVYGLLNLQRETLKYVKAGNIHDKVVADHNEKVLQATRAAIQRTAQVTAPVAAEGKSDRRSEDLFDDLMKRGEAVDASGNVWERLS